MNLLQVALDFLRLEDALPVVEHVRDHVDHVEIGTPLVKAEGLQGIRVLSTLAHLGKRKSVADLKVLDTGFLEAEMAFQAGADYVTVAGGAPIETILGALEAKVKYDKGIIVDLIGVDPVRKAEEFKQKGIDSTIDFLEIHRGIDQAGTFGFDRFLEQLRALRDRISTRLAVAGSLNEVTVPKVTPYADLIVVGGAITKATQPGDAACRIRRALEGRD
ncbi:MAG: orotidine 5'-phosphate decarboxylase / HUMPS family protein [Candidatus Methylomirabilales bacterium]